MSAKVMLWGRRIWLTAVFIGWALLILRTIQCDGHPTKCLGEPIFVLSPTMQNAGGA